MATVALHIIAKDELQELKRIITNYTKYFDKIDIALDDKHTIDMLQLHVDKGWEDVNLYYYAWSEEEKKRGYPNFDDKRNFLVSKCKCDYYFRLDTDDLIVNPEIVSSIIERAEEIGVEIVSCKYDYSRDEHGISCAVHNRETIIKSNGKYTWNKHIHRNLQPVTPDKSVPIVTDKDLVVRHLLTDEHAKKSQSRNLKFLLDEYEATKDNPDPRTMAYLGRMLYPMGHLKEAKFFLEKHIATSGWDEDKYLSWCYLAEVMMALGDFDQALACCHEAMNERPDYPDAYLKIHSFYHEKGEWQKAIHWGKLGLQFKRGETNMVTDPSSYTWRPAISMAFSYLMVGESELAMKYFNAAKQLVPDLEWLKENQKTFEASLLYKKYIENFAWNLELLKAKDKDKIPTLFEAIPKELIHHELLVKLKHRHLKPRVHGDKEISIYCGQAWEDWAAPSVLKGIGGSEEAVIYLSKELTKLGYLVTVYCSCGDLAGTYEGVTYKDFFEFNPYDEYNTVIAWRGNIFGNIQAKRKLIWLHDVPSGMFSETEVDTFDRVIVLSNFHKSLLPNFIPVGKAFVSSNGINLKDFRLKDAPERNPYRMIYTSSYDRGIEHLLKMWGEIKKEVPQAELHLFYGWETYDAMLAKGLREPQFKNYMLELMKQPGVFEHGRVSHKKLNKELYKSKFFVYPSHFEEISCISAMKAQACGCVPVVINYAALKETVKDGIRVEGKGGGTATDFAYKKALIKALKEQPEIKVDKEQFGWDKVAKQWSENIL